MSRPVRVAIDFNCPASYPAVAATRALESRLGTAFEWLPLPAVAWARASVVVPDDDRRARHFRLRTQYLESELRRYAASRGLELGDIPRRADTSAASLGLLWLGRWARGAADGYVERVFDRIWRENAESDPDFVEKALADHAGEFRSWSEGDGPRELNANRERLVSEGVWNVPAYVAGGEVFFGRQHLSLVERLAVE